MYLQCISRLIVCHDFISYFFCIHSVLWSLVTWNLWKLAIFRRNSRTSLPRLFLQHSLTKSIILSLKVSAAESCQGILNAFGKLIYHLVNLKPSFLMMQQLLQEEQETDNDCILYTENEDESFSNAVLVQKPIQLLLNFMSGKKNGNTSPPSPSDALLSSSCPSSSSFLANLLKKTRRQSTACPPPSNPTTPLETKSCSPSISFFSNRRSASIDVPSTSFSHNYHHPQRKCSNYSPSIYSSSPDQKSNASSIMMMSTSAPAHKKSWTSQFSSRFSNQEKRIRKTSFPLPRNRTSFIWIFPLTPVLFSPVNVWYIYHDGSSNRVILLYNHWHDMTDFLAEVNDYNYKTHPVLQMLTIHASLYPSLSWALSEE